MNGDATLKALPIGPASIAAIMLAMGFLLAVAYNAWQRKDKFEVPTRDFLAVFIVIAFIAVIADTFVTRPSEGADILIGALVAAFSAIVTIYFKIGGGKDE
jgi:heme/copper-type cytochrome/quinol oxidase subunit 3